MKTAHDLWQQLKDVPVDDDGFIQGRFLHFWPVVTHREEIWHWFEETFDCSIEELKVSDVRNDAVAYHIVSTNGSSIMVRASVGNVTELDAVLRAVSSPYPLAVIEVGAAGTLKIRPV